MSLKVENLEHNMAKLTVEVPAEQLDDAILKAYNKQKANITLPGFRKGKAPLSMVLKQYGPEVFYEDAANYVITEEYPKAYDESGLDIVSQPEIDVLQLEKGKEFIFTATVAVKPEVTLGEYKGVKVDKTEVAVTEEDVDAELKKVQDQNARMITVEDRAVADGDEVTIDYSGSVDGVLFEGGTAEDQQLLIGSHTFIDNFEEQLIGKNIGDAVDVNVTFPEQYHAPELAGKPALFKVVIKGIKAKELPELDDDFAADVSEFDTLDEYKEDIKKHLLEEKEKAAKTAKENAVVDAIVEAATMDVPDAMVATQQRQMVDEFAQRLSYQGMQLEQYLQFTGSTVEEFMEQAKPQALKRIQTRLVLEAIVKAEQIEATEEDMNKELEKMASMYQMELEKINELMGENERKQIKEDIAVQKAVDFVVDAAIEA
ncbi:MAG: trigger factor [Lachnospiraceae bacterium]